MVELSHKADFSYVKLGDLYYEVSKDTKEKKIPAQNVEVIFAVTYVMIFKHSGL